MTKTTMTNWMDQPEAHDYPAALDYLSLGMTEEEAAEQVDRLRTAPMTHRKAKDILRASGLPLLGVDNKHVGADHAKVTAGKRLSPVLLIRGCFAQGSALVVADGYHRVCASYWIDENADIPCKLT